MTRLVLADDRALIRDGLRRTLSDFADLLVVAETTTGIDLLERAAEVPADVVLLSVAGDWPRIIALIPALRQAELRVLVLATAPEPRWVGRAENAGAAGAITTDASAVQLAAAVRRVANGRAPLGKGGITVRVDRPDRPLPELSGREFEVMRLLAGGHTAKDIAARLGLSPKTVATYRGRVLDKLGLDSTVQLVRFALERGLAGQGGGQD
jgi:DNA-binding NarL/FixJ family response regulator